MRSLAQVLQAQNAVELKRTWIVLPFSSWWKDLVLKGDSVIVHWDLARLVSTVLKRYVPISLFEKIRSAYFSSSHEAKRNSVSRKIEKIGVDIVHLAIQDGVVTNLPYIYHPHDLQHLHYPSYFDESTIAHRENHWRSLASSSAKIICASEFVRNDLKTLWKIDDSKIQVLPMPTPDPLVNLTAVAPQKKNSIICVANFWPHKNQSTLISAARRILEKFPDLQITFIGDGPKRGECEDLVRELGLTGNVSFLGNISQLELEKKILESTVVCVPSEFEAASFPIIEGMKFGKQIVASSIGPFLEIQSSGIRIYGEPRDEVSLARTLVEVFYQPELGDETKASFAKYLDSIAPEEVGNKVIGIYKFVIASQLQK